MDINFTFRIVFVSLFLSFISYAQQNDVPSYQKALKSYENNDYASALQQALLIQDQCKREKNDMLLFKTLRLIGNCHKSTGNYKKSRSSYLQALSGFKKLNDSIHLIGISNNLAKIYFPLHKFDSVVYYAQKSLKYNKGIKDTLNGISSYADLVSIYVYQEKLDLALNYGNKALELLQNQSNKKHSSLISLFNNIGNLHFKEKDYQLALKYYEKAYDLFDQDVSLRLKNYVVKNLTSVHIMLGEKEHAQEFISAALDLRDSINRINYNVRLTEIEFNYNQEKAVHVEMLRTQAERQKNVHLQIWLLIVILIALVVSSVVYFYYYKNKNKKNKLALRIVNQQFDQHQKMKRMQLHNQNKILDAIAKGKETERMSISQFLHDSVGALLSSANMHLQVVKKNSKNNIDEFQKAQNIILEASDKIRDLSHQLISSSLVKFGLLEGLQVLIDKYSNEELIFELYCENEIPRFNQSFELKMYNIIEELLNNVIKHSNASESLITLTFKNEKFLTLQVEDNGKGFDESKVELYEGIGLSQIKSRVESQKGSFKIDSKLQKYTKITIIIPVVY